VRPFGGPQSLDGELYCTVRTDVQSVTADSCLCIQALYRPLTLLLHGCEGVQLVTLRYCSLQEDKTDTVRVTLYCAVFVLTLPGCAMFGKRIIIGAIAWDLDHPTACGKC